MKTRYNPIGGEQMREISLVMAERIKLEEYRVCFSGEETKH